MAACRSLLGLWSGRRRRAAADIQRALAVKTWCIGGDIEAQVHQLRGIHSKESRLSAITFRAPRLREQNLETNKELVA